ncbi:hypothetical protein [Epilithonimonas sp.]|uniref:hypothetical protein n=1 Tax=Epilithonimonas sp. TaxID=2894511 RepID=UPI0028A69740|nr:hypothetical protein [Epilithonimonas sp.]
MYLTKLDNNQTFTSIYRSLLIEIIAGNNEGVKNEIDQAIYEAIDVISGKKEAYLIDNKHFYFTNFLISNKEILNKEIADTSITNNTYKDIALALNA